MFDIIGEMMVRDVEQELNRRMRKQWKLADQAAAREGLSGARLLSRPAQVRRERASSVLKRWLRAPRALQG